MGTLGIAIQKGGYFFIFRREVALDTGMERHKNICIAEEVETAESFAERLKGLLGRRSLPAGKGLLIRPCNSIHSCFMRFSFDAVFINSDLSRRLPDRENAPFQDKPCSQRCRDGAGTSGRYDSRTAQK